MCGVCFKHGCAYVCVYEEVWLNLIKFIIVLCFTVA